MPNPNRPQSSQSATKPQSAGQTPWRFRSRLGAREYFLGDVTIGRRFSSQFKNGGGVSGAMHWVVERGDQFIGRAKSLTEAKAIADTRANLLRTER